MFLHVQIGDKTKIQVVLNQVDEKQSKAVKYYKRKYTGKYSSAYPAPASAAHVTASQQEVTSALSKSADCLKISRCAGHGLYLGTYLSTGRVNIIYIGFRTDAIVERDSRPEIDGPSLVVFTKNRLNNYQRFAEIFILSFGQRIFC